ncbi:MAG: transposase family protein, partial [Bacteroidota bacterium]
MFCPLPAEQWEAYETAFAADGYDDGLRIVAILDGKLLQICRPTQHQRAMYTQYKKCHGVKFQGLETPDGLLVHTTEAQSGRNHDARMFRNSNLGQFWEANERVNQYRILADTAYPNGGNIVSMYAAGQFEGRQERRDFNEYMAPVRQPVEWGFQRVTSLWGFLNSKHQMKMLQMSISDLWLLGVWLTNVKTCADGGNNTSTYFDVMPSSIEEYLDITLGGGAGDGDGGEGLAGGVFDVVQMEHHNN